MIKHKLLSLFVALIATTALWASNTITYTAKAKLTCSVLNVGRTTFGPAITSHTFSNGTGTITCSGEITTIGYYAFEYCSGLTSITIPNSVKTIGSYAFEYCSGLTSITIPNSVTTIGEKAFYNCTGLTSVTIPNSVTTIGLDAFYNCTGLTSITIPNSVTTIGQDAFKLVNNIVYSGTAKWETKDTYLTFNNPYWGAKCLNGYVEGYLVYSDNTKTTLCGCSSAATGEIIIPNSVTTIGGYAFYNCSGLTSSITIPNSVTAIGDYAFYNCSGLTSVTIPSSVTTIELRTFSGCTGLTSVTIPSSITTIGICAFEDCTGLVSVTIPNSVKTIGQDAFELVNNIMYSGTAKWETEDTYMTKNNPYWGAKCMNGYVEGYLVYSDNTKTTLCGCSSAATGEIIIPNSVTTIGDYAFYECSKLTSVTIPNSVTSIGIVAFYECTSIKKVYVSSSYPFEEAKVSSIITNAFAATTPQYILQYEAQISTDDATPTCAFVHVDLSKMETSQYAKMALDFAGTKYELNTKESTVILTGLTPASTNHATFYSQLVGESQWREGATLDLTTLALTLTTLTPKVVSAGTAIVAAETNISDYETNVGFEWRKFDAPSTMPSKSGAAILYNGMMEGKLLNLGTDAYWNVRPYYEAADGTRYCGEWITFDPSDFSYFEPTVHTYAMATSPTSNKTQVRGYVMTGTDDVTEQGFEYWFRGAKAPRRMASATPDSIYRVQASGQVMTAVLEDLAYSTTYTCRAYAVAGGKTYYGEEVQFLTPEDPRPIYTLYVMAGENGSVNTDVSGQYREGETVTLTATAEQGFRFMQWSDGNTDNPRQLTIMANTELVALFELADGLEGLTIDNAQCTVRKFIRNNQLQIFRNGKMYNAMGGVMR